MMSELCAFFQRNAVKETNENMRVKFDFSKIGKADIAFDLEHFKEVLAEYELVKKLVEFYQLTANEAFSLNRIFSPNYIWSKAPWIDAWVKDFQNGVMNPLPAPKTGYSDLDEQLINLFRLFNDFLETARSWGITVKNASDFFNITGDKADRPLGTWDKQTVAYMMSDLWPNGFLSFLYYRLETIEALPYNEQASDASSLALTIKDFLDAHTVTVEREDELFKKLEELLKLPVWKQRHELYSVWILALMDQVMVKYPQYKVHHHDGVLLMEFRRTLLCSFETAGGPLTLWSEVKLPHDSPVGHTRTAAIQPDYIFFKGDVPSVEQASIVVEVKQYKTPSTKNFSDALNDYASGLPNAHVFLVNYGNVRDQMPLDQPERCTAIGQVRPITEPAQSFLQLLSERLPPLPVPTLPNVNMDELVPFTFFDWGQLMIGYQKIYVDISGSLDNDVYRQFLDVILRYTIRNGLKARLRAVDTRLRGEWVDATEADVASLLALSFNGQTSFGYLVDDSISHSLIITDKDGLNIVRYLPYNSNLHVICFDGKEPAEYHTDQLRL